MEVRTVATAHAGAGTSRFGRVASTWRRVTLGAPLAASAVAHERMRKLVALPILSSDALSSVAYAPDEILLTLSLAGLVAYGYSWKIAILVAVVMLVYTTMVFVCDEDEV